MTTQRTPSRTARSAGLFSPLLAGWRGLVSLIEWFGEFALFGGRLFLAAIRPPYEGKELLREFDELGSKSLPLVILAGAATGVVLAMSTHDSLVRFGVKSFLPAVVVYSLIRESGPIITGLVLSGRAGAGIGAELGAMKVTEQVDAMTASGVDPLKYLAATRVLACVLMLPLLTAIADFSGIVTGWIADTLMDPISFRLFLHKGLSGAGFSDFLPPTGKTMIFGLVIGLVASFQGLRATGGTEGVARAATSAVVIASLGIIVADVVLVRLIIVFFS